MKTDLRKGWTTGACAAGAARAAYQALRTGAFPDPVTVRLPRGLAPAFPLSRAELRDGAAVCGIIKDAGDDPDVTHGAEIVVEARLGAAGGGIVFRAGEGVGTVTLPGLPLAVGEPAINPAPRAIIADNIADVAAAFGGGGDVVLTISIPGGEALAAKTMNGRLGIIGGLSVLGTTGVVVPYSCSAWVHSIHNGIDVARALGIGHIAGATGKTSEAAVRRLHGLDEQAMIDMGGFAGGMLKYLRRHPVPRVTIAGGFAKMVKLAAGEMDLHSKASRVDVATLADLLAELGAPAATVAAARKAPSAAAVLAVADGVDLGGAVARRAREVALATLAGGIHVDVAVFDRAGRLVGHAA